VTVTVTAAGSHVAPGLAGSRGRWGRGAPKSSDPGGVAGRWKKIGVANSD
jgi:hypothetical protein